MSLKEYTAPSCADLTQQLIGSETQTAARVRKHRENIALQCNATVTERNETATICNTDKEKEIDLEERDERGEGTPAPAPKKSSPKAERHRYGEYKHVLLTDEQYKNLNVDFGSNAVAVYIKKVDEYCQQTGKTYKDYNLTIRNWIRKDGNFNGNGSTRDVGAADTEHSKYALEF